MTSSLAPCLSAFMSDGNRCQSILTVKREDLGVIGLFAQRLFEAAELR